jgi:tyrosinase
MVLPRPLIIVEPLFFLHHAQIDRLWWLWQQGDASRLSDYTGAALHFNETEATEVSLDDVLLMGGIEEDLKVRDVMDIHNEKLCYTY